MTKVYIVGWTDSKVGTLKEVFVTDDANKVAKWCIKFNNILQKYKKFLRKFEDFSGTDVEEKYFDEWYIRWSDINRIEGAAYMPIQFR